MATPPSPMLTANFLRAVRSCRPQTYRSLRNAPTRAVKRLQVHTTSRKLQQEQGYQRYGPAATPAMPPPPKPTDPFQPSTEQTNKDASEPESKKAESESQEAKEVKENPNQKTETNPKQESPDQEKDAGDTEAQPGEETHETSSTDVKQVDLEPPSEHIQQPPVENIGDPLPNRELDMVLSIPAPSELKGDDHPHHPHLEASPYEHHFDTYSLVQDLCKDELVGTDQNAFTEEQAVTLMKAIRLMLAQNLDLAKDGLVSKSDTENETYLFRAACSELKTTMQTSRFMEAQKQRSQRAQVQHEFDILNQKVGQDIMTMREELKGMFNERKLGLQEEKRQVDGKIQGLSYRISVDLNSEAKSEVEGLRWVLTRRAVLAIGAAASMTLAFLQYYSVKTREQAEVEKKRKAAKKAQDERLKKEQERFGNNGPTVGRSTGTQTDGILLSGTAGREYEESLG